MPQYVVGRILGTLESLGVEPRGARLFVLGVTYKRDVADLRNSRAVEIIEDLMGMGSDVLFHDPFHKSIEVRGTTLTRSDTDGISRTDLVVVLTDHSSYDWGALVQDARAVFDARGATRHIDCDHVTRL